ncbi:probable serine incorporator isoform X2 [Ricinus communis]|uniref:probable serine incorporator isoform X2 n=1 Tax=Ricinus communis TaxID=3988 RepID=UPI00201B1FD5|nr:probable serine incorporator isoform X2 [Ricinus communis]
MSCLVCFASCCATMTCGLCTSVASGISKKSARLAYCGLFGLSLIVSWILREFGAPLIEKLPWIKSSVTHSKEWFQIQAVLRVSLGNFLFFAIFALIMIGVKDQNDRRDSWHHGGWIAKMVIWLLLLVLMFFMPNVVIAIYGIISKFGAGLFLLVQVIILLDFTHSWNDAWVEKDEQKCEPHDYVCNGLHNKTKAVSTSTLILGMLTTILSVLYSAVRAGSSTTFLSPPSSPKASDAKKPLLEEQLEEGKEKKETEARPVSYSYTFFHLIFALASMYSAMLLSGWTSSSESSDLIDVGWTSVWVRICTEWVTAGLYVWTLLAPLLFPDREFF